MTEKKRSRRTRRILVRPGVALEVLKKNTQRTNWR